MSEQQPAQYVSTFKVYLSSRCPENTAEIERIFEKYESQLQVYLHTQIGKNQKYQYFQDTINPNVQYSLEPFNTAPQKSVEFRADLSAGIQFPYFNQLLDQVKQMLGPYSFMEAIKNYVLCPEHTQKIKEEMIRLEKEVLNASAKEEEKMVLSGIAIPKESITFRHFDYSTFEAQMQEEFKNAKWVVLTTPIVSKQNGKVGSNPSTIKDSINSNSILIQQNSSSAALQPTNSLNKTSSSLSAINQVNQQGLKVINPPPQKRYAHSATLVKNKMFIFGGTQTKGGNLQNFYECLFKFNSDDGLLFNWDRVKSDAPKARDSHTCIHAGDSLIVFGGSGGDWLFNDLNRFDIKSQKWFKMEAVGDIPKPREGHTARLIGKDKMMIHGGVHQDENQQMIAFNDTYILTGLSHLSQSQQSNVIQYLEAKQTTPVQMNIDFGNNALGSFDTNSKNAPQALNSQIKLGGGSNVLNQNILNNNNLETSQLRWYKCIQRGQIPEGRDSHSSAMINNKIYIFGGQGDHDMIFDDLHCVEIIEEIQQNGEIIFIANWTRLDNRVHFENQNQNKIPKPIARTSHSCTVYKNRFLIIIGGETDTSLGGNQTINQGDQLPQKTKINNEICIEIDQEGNSSDQVIFEYFQQKLQDPDYSQKQDETGQFQEKNKFLNDVWAYDTLLNLWFEIKAPLKIQGPLAGKKIKKVFEPRMAHSAVQYDQFVVVFGGLNEERQNISNDLFVLSLNGELGQIQKSFESAQEQKQQIQIPDINIMEKQPQAQGQKDKIKIVRTLKMTEPEDRKEMSGQVLNQIINFNNFNSNQTNQIILNGNQFFASTSSNQGYGGGSYSNQPKQDSQVQTCDTSTDNLNEKNLEVKQVQLILKQNEFALRSFQRTKISFFKSLIKSIDWPLQCFAGLIDNSIQAFELQKFIQEQPKPVNQTQFGLLGHQSCINPNHKMSSITIDINMKSLPALDLHRGSENQKIYIEIKDNGPGIHPKQLMESLTSFGSNNILNLKSDYNFSEHGINLKICSLRLSNSALIITKTKPVMEFGSSSQYLSIALLSFKFIEEACSQYLVSPIISYELKNKKIIKDLTPQPEHFLNKISHYTSPLFKTGEQILQYSMNIITDCGTHIFLLDLKTQTFSKNDVNTELIINDSDIILNPKCFVNEYQIPGILECSLRKYLKFLYVEQPENVKINLNGSSVDMNNPYSQLKQKYAGIFRGERQEMFAAQILDTEALRSQLNLIKMEDQKADSEIDLQQTEQIILKEISELQGILVYRGAGRLIRRIENVFGDDENLNLEKSLRNSTTEGQLKTIFNKNGIVSVFKSKSSTQIDKKDFSDKMIIRKIREWLKQKDATNSVEKATVSKSQPLTLEYFPIKPSQEQINAERFQDPKQIMNQQGSYETQMKAEDRLE